MVNHSQIIQITQETNHPITLIIEVDHQNKAIHKISHKTDIVNQIAKITSIETTIHDQIQTEEESFLIPVPIQILGIETIQAIDYNNNYYNRSDSNNRNQRYQNKDQGTIPITDLIINETITITIIGHKTTHKIGIPTTTLDEIILNPLIETTIVTLSPNTNIELTHQNISDKLIRYKQLNKQLQIPLVLTTRKIPNYN